MDTNVQLYSNVYNRIKVPIFSNLILLYIACAVSRIKIRVVGTSYEKRKQLAPSKKIIHNAIEALVHFYLSFSLYTKLTAGDPVYRLCIWCYNININILNSELNNSVRRKVRNRLLSPPSCIEFRRSANSYYNRDQCTKYLVYQFISYTQNLICSNLYNFILNLSTTVHIKINYSLFQ